MEKVQKVKNTQKDSKHREIEWKHENINEYHGNKGRKQLAMQKSSTTTPNQFLGTCLAARRDTLRIAHTYVTDRLKLPAFLSPRPG